MVNTRPCLSFLTPSQLGMDFSINVNGVLMGAGARQGIQMINLECGSASPLEGRVDVNQEHCVPKS